MKNKTKNLGIYVHIPFCRSKCPYCDFFSVISKEKVHSYVGSVVREIEKRGDKSSCIVDTLYIGGGTPSAIPENEIERIISTVKKSFNCELSEVTVECNPSDCRENFFKVLAENGVNRISFGMQSAVESERKILGRLSDKAQVKKAIEIARKSGMNNISLDVMIGVPNQTKLSLLESINFCEEMKVNHISAYMLQIEKGTFYYNHRDRFNFADDDEMSELYLLLVDELEKRGFSQYEISNFAKSGFESKHNLKYWQLDDYLGIGASAHSFINGKRYFYPRDIEFYTDGGEPIQDGTGGDTQEKIMLGLRLKEGIKVDILSERAKREIPELVKNDLCICSNDRLHLTAKGFLISNSIINLLID